MRRGYFRTELLADERDERTGHDRWIISYADFITLLFAFFVVMYAISSVNDGKFRVLSASLLKVFEDPQVSAALEQRRRKAAGVAARGEGLDPADAEFAPEMAPGPAALRADELAPVLSALLSDAIARGEARVDESKDWTEVELGADYAFGPGGAQLTPGPAALINDLATIAQGVDTQVRVEAFTDAAGEQTDETTAKWERSAAQAASVAAALVAQGVDPDRISAAAFGDRHPVASNASEDGRRRNRRVVVSIARHGTVPAAAVSRGAVDLAEELAPPTYRRVTELPEPEEISL